MRLAIVSPYSWTVPSGVNSHVLSLVKQLEARQHEVWVIAPAARSREPAGVTPSKFIRAGGTLAVPSNGSVAHANASPFMLQHMRHLLASRDLDLVHVHEPTIPSVGCSATMAARTPVVATFHAAGAASHHYERWYPLAERILESITVRVAVSEAARDCVARHFPGDYRIVPNGIDLETYAGARSEEKVAGRILFIGRPEPRKGLAVLVEAFGALRRRVPAVSLAVVGTTREELHALVAHNNGKSNGKLDGVLALGRVSLEEKLGQMRQAEVLCAPSLGDESFGMVLTEALAAGVPVVASDIPGYRAVLAGGTAGELVSPGDPGALESALFATLENDRLRSRLATAGVELAARYSWDRVAAELIEIYEQALSLGPRIVTRPAVPAFKQLRHLLTPGKDGAKPAAPGQGFGR